MEGRYERMAKYLDGLRWLAGLTQQELSDKLGITRETLTKIKKSNTMPPLYYHAIRDVFRIYSVGNKELKCALYLLVDSGEFPDENRERIWQDLRRGYKALGPRAGMHNIMYRCRHEFNESPATGKYGVELISRTIGDWLNKPRDKEEGL